MGFWKSICFSHNAELKKEVASTIAYLKEESAEEETDEEKVHRTAAAAIAPLEIATNSKSPSIQVRRKSFAPDYGD